MRRVGMPLLIRCGGEMWRICWGLYKERLEVRHGQEAKC